MCLKLITKHGETEPLLERPRSSALIRVPHWACNAKGFALPPASCAITLLRAKMYGHGLLQLWKYPKHSSCARKLELRICMWLPDHAAAAKSGGVGAMQGAPPIVGKNFRKRYRCASDLRFLPPMSLSLRMKLRMSCSKELAAPKWTGSCGHSQ